MPTMEEYYTFFLIVEKEYTSQEAMKIMERCKTTSEFGLSVMRDGKWQHNAAMYSNEVLAAIELAAETLAGKMRDSGELEEEARYDKLQRNTCKI